MNEARFIPAAPCTIRVSVVLQINGRVFVRCVARIRETNVEGGCTLWMRQPVHAATAESPFSGHDSFAGAGARSHLYTQNRRVPRA